MIEYEDVEMVVFNVESETAGILVPSSNFYLCLNLAEMVGVELLLVDVPFFFGAQDCFLCFWNGFAVGFTTSFNMNSAKETHNGPNISGGNDEEA